MLYDENTLTEDEAQRIIGEKMNLRIDFLNEFAKKYGYLFLLHSTDKTNTDSILKDGVKYSNCTYDSRNDLLTDSNITENDLQSLEAYVKTNGGVASLDSLYQTYQRESATVTHKTKISAKTLLEYSHRDANATVVFLVPKLQEQILGKQSDDEFFMGRTRRGDPYLRRKVYCRIKNGEFEYKSKYSYPPQAIAFIFDRNNNLIKINNDFDETYYFDNSSSSGNIQKGLISAALKNPENIIDNITEFLR